MEDFRRQKRLNALPSNAILEELMDGALPAYELSVRLKLTMGEVYKRLATLKERGHIMVSTNEREERVWSIT